MTKSSDGQSFGPPGEDKDRRVASVVPLPVLHPSDFDAPTGTLRLQRFMALMVERQQDAPGALMIIDLDNQSLALGQHAGEIDEFLPPLSQAIRQAVRNDDWIAHVAGFKFALLLHGADQALADGIADRIRESVADTLFLTENGIAQLGVAIGGVAFTPARSRQGSVFEAANSNLAEARHSQSGTCIR
jgi:diguanylate cyclase (GGDEF)-like protein